MSASRTHAQFANHYPERLGQIVCLSPPLIFFALYRAVLPALDPVTRSKIVMLRSDKAWNEYAALRWSGERQAPIRAWLEATLKLPAKPCSFPDLALSRRLEDEATVKTLARCSEKGVN